MKNALPEITGFDFRSHTFTHDQSRPSLEVFSVAASATHELPMGSTWNLLFAISELCFKFNVHDKLRSGALRSSKLFPSASGSKTCSIKDFDCVLHANSD